MLIKATPVATRATRLMTRCGMGYRKRLAVLTASPRTPVAGIRPGSVAARQLVISHAATASRASPHPLTVRETRSDGARRAMVKQALLDVAKNCRVKRSPDRHHLREGRRARDGKSQAHRGAACREQGSCISHAERQ